MVNGKHGDKPELGFHQFKTDYLCSNSVFMSMLSHREGHHWAGFAEVFTQNTS